MTENEGQDDPAKTRGVSLLGIPLLPKPPADPFLSALLFLLVLPLAVVILSTRLAFIGVLLVLGFLRVATYAAYAKPPPIVRLLLLIPAFALLAAFTVAMLPLTLLLRCNLVLSGYDQTDREDCVRAVTAPVVGPPTEMGRVVQAMDEFMGLQIGKVTEPLRSKGAGGLVTILFTDVERSTALTQRLGDAKAREVLRTHERIVREALKAHGGSEVKTMGDGFMASFSSATRALECAIAMQRAFAEHNESAQEPIRVRIGLNAGEPIAEEKDLFGTAVIMASRIAANAEGGEILTANVVRELAAGKGFLFSDRGDVALRGFEDSVRLYVVSWGEET